MKMPLVLVVLMGGALFAGVAPANQICSAPVVPIPELTEVTDTITVPDGATISDLDVSLEIDHTWIGDVEVRLTHAACDVQLIHRIGLVGDGCCGCSGDGIDVVLDDQAASSVEDSCGSNPVTGGAAGAFTPGSPQGDGIGGSLSDCNGADSSGDWVLHITDAQVGDSGTLLEWCLDIDAGGEAPGWVPLTPGAPPTPMSVDIEENASGVTVHLEIFGFYEHELTTDVGDFTCATIPGCGDSGAVGGPTLPFRRLVVELPLGSDPAITISQEDTVDVPRDLPACPMQESCADCDDECPPFVFEPGLYTGDDFVPAQTVEITDLQNSRRKRVAHIDVTPVRYNPDTNTLRFTTEVTFDVSVDVVQEPQPWELLGADYIIIVGDDPNNNNDLRADCVLQDVNQIDRFADWKRQKGYVVHVIKTTQIPGFDPDNPGGSEAAIFDYLSDQYYNRTPMPQYVLLIGDAPHLIPSHLSVSGTYYSDWRFTTVQGFDDDVDYTPDMAIGRLPVDDGAGCAAALEKILNYDMTPSTGSWYGNTLLAAYFQDYDEDNNGVLIDPIDCEAARYYVDTISSIHDYFDTIRDPEDTHTVLATETWCGSDYLPRKANGGTAPGHLPDGREVDNPLRYTDADFIGRSDNGAQTSAITDAFLNEGIGLAVHRDHGTSFNTRWLYPWFESSDVSSLNNAEATPVVMSMNCSTGKFVYEQPQTDKPCIAEAFIERQGGGAVAVIAPTGITNGSPNELLLMGFIGGVWNEYTEDYFSWTNEDRRLASLHSFMRHYLYEFMWDAKTNARAHAEKYHIFGDPEMEFRTQSPVLFDAFSYQAWIDPNAVQYLVSADISEGLHGALVGLSQVDASGNVISLGHGIMVDQGGQTVALVQLLVNSDPLHGPVTVTITHGNIIPFQVEIPVNPVGLPTMSRWGLIFTALLLLIAVPIVLLRVRSISGRSDPSPV